MTVESTGFDEAPDIILKAVQRLSWFGRQAVKNAAAVMETVPAEERILPTEFVPFNECLALGYFSDSMISVGISTEHASVANAHQ